MNITEAQFLEVSVYYQKNEYGLKRHKRHDHNALGPDFVTKLLGLLGAFHYLVMAPLCRELLLSDVFLSRVDTK